MITVDDLQKALDTLQRVKNSAAHPDIALRVVMVDLKPIRQEIERLTKKIESEKAALDTTQKPDTLK